jgi:hypothetical protein
LRCPLSNAGNFTKPGEEVGGIYHAVKVDAGIANRTRQRTDGFGSGSRQANASEVSIGQRAGLRKNVSYAPGRGKWLPESFHEPACQRGRSFDANLLTENRPNRKFEAIPAARHAQPWFSLKPHC